MHACLLHRLQPSNFLDSQGFDSYDSQGFDNQGLPKWSPIVCQGSGQKSALTAFLYSSYNLSCMKSEECFYDTKLPSELLSKSKRLLFSH